MSKVNAALIAIASVIVMFAAAIWLYFWLCSSLHAPPWARTLLACPGPIFIGILARQLYRALAPKTLPSGAVRG